MLGTVWLGAVRSPIQLAHLFLELRQDRVGSSSSTATSDEKSSVTRKWDEWGKA